MLIFEKTMIMSKLQDLPNIGKTLAEKLSLAEINTSEDLQNIGSENAFIKLKTIDKNACINMLYAIEGAVQGIRWHGISKERKQELLSFYNSISL